MRTIYKYPIQITGEVQEIEMPHDSIILDFQEQGTRPFVWAEVDSEGKEQVKRRFQIFGTGTEIPKDDPPKWAQYIGTIQRGIYVWHLYEMKGPTE